MNMGTYSSKHRDLLDLCYLEPTCLWGDTWVQYDVINGLFDQQGDQLGDPELAIEVYSWENHETQRQIFQQYLITGNQIKQWEERR